jgi:hypothetical protein
MMDMMRNMIMKVTKNKLIDMLEDAKEHFKLREGNAKTYVRN